MSYFTLERVKTISLVLLILGCFIQIGILWDVQNHGLPINFFRGNMNDRELLKDYDAKSLLMPSRIIVSQGYDEPHRLIEAQSESFGQIWSEVSSYLKDILLEKKMVAKVAYNDLDWGNLTVKKGLTLSFLDMVDAKLLYYFLGLDQGLIGDFRQFKKLVFSLDEPSVHEMAIYITDETTIWKYTVKPHQASSEKLLTWEFTPANSQEQNGQYKMLKEIFPRPEKAPFTFKPDIPVYLLGDKIEKYRILAISLPDWLLAVETSRDNVSSAEKAILGGDKDSYDTVMDEVGNLTFGNVNNIYRISKSGILEYKYLAQQDPKEIVDVTLAFEWAVDFINTRNRLAGLRNDASNGCKLNLIGVKYNREKGSYSFSLNYLIGGVPVVYLDDGGNSLGLIQVDANSERVTNCRMLLRKLRLTDNVRDYNLSFKNFSIEFFKLSSSSGLKKLHLEDAFVGYVLGNSLNSAVEPRWVVENKAGDYDSLSLPVLEKVGE